MSEEDFILLPLVALAGYTVCWHLMVKPYDYWYYEQKRSETPPQDLEKVNEEIEEERSRQNRDALVTGGLLVPAMFYAGRMVMA